jgi:hypothetical protein
MYAGERYSFSVNRIGWFPYPPSILEPRRTHLCQLPRFLDLNPRSIHLNSRQQALLASHHLHHIHLPLLPANHHLLPSPHPSHLLSLPKRRMKATREMIGPHLFVQTLQVASAPDVPARWTVLSNSPPHLNLPFHLSRIS